MTTLNNRLVAEAQAVEKSPRGLFLFLQTLGLFLSFFVLQGLMSLLARPLATIVKANVHNPLMLNALGSGIFGLVFSTAPMIIGVILWTVLVEKRKATSVGIGGPRKLQRYMVGFGLGMLFMAVTAVGILTVGSGSIDNSALPAYGFAALPYILIMLVGWLVQGASEEFIIQGWLMPKGVKTFGVWVGVAISSTIFSALHLGNSGVSMLAVINLALYAIFAAALALYEEGILGVCGFHSAWNFAQGNVFGFLVSGGSVRGGSFLGIVSHEANLINGGAFGPEGGLIVTVVLLAGVLVLVKLHRDKAARTSSGVVL